MSFNYGREEKQLRSLGVGEDTIEKLRIYDWAVFNSDRKFYRRLKDAGTYLEEFAEDTTQLEVKTVEDFLDNIESQRIYERLINNACESLLELLTGIIFWKLMLP